MGRSWKMMKPRKKGAMNQYGVEARKKRLHGVEGVLTMCFFLFGTTDVIGQFPYQAKSCRLFIQFKNLGKLTSKRDKRGKCGLAPQCLFLNPGPANASGISEEPKCSLERGSQFDSFVQGLLSSFLASGCKLDSFTN